MRPKPSQVQWKEMQHNVTLVAPSKGRGCLLCSPAPRAAVLGWAWELQVPSWYGGGVYSNIGKLNTLPGAPGAWLVLQGLGAGGQAGQVKPPAELLSLQSSAAASLWVLLPPPSLGSRLWPC